MHPMRIRISRPLWGYIRIPDAYPDQQIAFGIHPDAYPDQPTTLGIHLVHIWISQPLTIINNNSNGKETDN